MRWCSVIVALVVVGSTQAVHAQAPKERDPVQQAIIAGARFLKAQYAPGARNNPGGGPVMPGGPIAMPRVVGAVFNETGPACLAGLALLESGVAANDASVVNIAFHVRQVGMSLTGTYQVSLAIMFLDRLGSKGDVPMIQLLTLRLLTGQCADGTWGYQCEGLDLSDVEMRRLQAALVQETKLTTPSNPKTPMPKVAPKPREDIDLEPPKTPKKEPEAKEPPKKEELKGLHPELDQYLRLVNNARPRAGSGDHSNTQFATVGLWVGRRHFVEVNDALKRIDKHYRDCQAGDGGWGYTGAGGTSPSMTCAGLMGAAMGFGAKNVGGQGGDPGQDRVIENGLKSLGNVLAAAGADGERDRGGRFRFRQNDLSTNYYFLWSLERVGMTYGLTTIGKVDWYQWGSELLLTSQAADGSWERGAQHGATPVVNTSFALLFLGRANLAQDLSASLRGKVKDPGTSRLIGGGDLTKLIGVPSGSVAGSGGTTRPKPMDPDRPAPKVDAPMTVPPAGNDFDSKVTRLVRELVNADGDARDELLRTYRDAKGGEYTETLAQAVGRLSGDGQAKTRDALANRLTRMSSATLVEFLRDRNREIRRAAALACGAKDATRLPEFADALIRTLADDEPLVVQAARASLKTLSKQDHGPEAGASASDRGKAIMAWRKWWDTQRK